MSHSRARGALIVGAGLMGTWHVHALRRLGIGVSGVVDPDRERALALSRSAGRCPFYASVRESLAHDGHHTAHVCTPSLSHPSIIEELLEASLHVLVEKPLATSVTETRNLLAVAELSGRVLCPVHQFLFQRGVLRVCEALSEAGKVLHIDSVASSAGALDGGPERAEEVMSEILPHPLSLMRRLMGRMFAAAEWRAQAGMPGELRAVADCDEASLGILISMSGRPPRNTLRIMCERGTWHLDLFHGFAMRESPGTGRTQKVLRPFGLAASSLWSAGRNLARRSVARESAYPGLRELVRRFYRAVEEGGPAPISREEILDVAVARDRLLTARRR